MVASSASSLREETATPAPIKQSHSRAIVCPVVRGTMRNGRGASWRGLSRLTASAIDIVARMRSMKRAVLGAISRQAA
jgi:hypothetical protein